MEEKIILALQQEDLTWFTRLLRGERQFRYVVGFTHNAQWTTQILACQAKFFWLFFDNLTVGWRTDPQGDVIVDIGTSTDHFLLAWAYKSQYSQLAVWDSWLKVEIF